MQVGLDQRVHTHFGHNPGSLRLCSFDPNLQNIPRDAGGNEWQKWVKEIFVAPEGRLFWERDFSGIEAVLVGYFAGSARYTRLAKLGVHDYFSGVRLGCAPDLGLSDSDLNLALGEIKKRTKADGFRDVSKRCVHGGNYLMTPKKMAEEYPESFPTTKAAAYVQDQYFDCFPEIRKWHHDLCDRVDGTKRRVGNENEQVDPWTLGVCHVVNPFGYTHRFYNVLDWERVNLPSGGWEWVSSFGEDAKRLVSFLPQSTAAAIIKRAAKIIYNDYPYVGRTLRLLIHDSIFGEASKGDVELCLKVSRDVMNAPIPELPLDPAWGMGAYLTIGSEAKVGPSWGSMSEVKD